MKRGRERESFPSNWAERGDKPRESSDLQPPGEGWVLFTPGYLAGYRRLGEHLCGGLEGLFEGPPNPDNLAGRRELIEALLEALQELRRTLPVKIPPWVRVGVMLPGRGLFLDRYWWSFPGPILALMPPKSLFNLVGPKQNLIRSRNGREDCLVQNGREGELGLTPMGAILYRLVSNYPDLLVLIVGGTMMRSLGLYPDPLSLPPPATVAPYLGDAQGYLPDVDVMISTLPPRDGQIPNRLGESLESFSRRMAEIISKARETHLFDPLLNPLLYPLARSQLVRQGVNGKTYFFNPLQLRLSRRGKLPYLSLSLLAYRGEANLVHLGEIFPPLAQNLLTVFQASDACRSAAILIFPYKNLLAGLLIDPLAISVVARREGEWGQEEQCIPNRPPRRFSPLFVLWRGTGPAIDIRPDPISASALKKLPILEQLAFLSHAIRTAVSLGRILVDWPEAGLTTHFWAHPSGRRDFVQEIEVEQLHRLIEGLARTLREDIKRREARTAILTLIEALQASLCFPQAAFISFGIFPSETSEQIPEYQRLSLKILTHFFPRLNRWLVESGANGSLWSLGRSLSRQESSLSWQSFIRTAVDPFNVSEKIAGALQNIFSLPKGKETKASLAWAIQRLAFILLLAEAGDGSSEFDQIGKVVVGEQWKDLKQPLGLKNPPRPFLSAIESAALALLVYPYRQKFSSVVINGTQLNRGLAALLRQCLAGSLPAEIPHFGWLFTKWTFICLFKAGLLEDVTINFSERFSSALDNWIRRRANAGEAKASQF